MSKAMGYSKTTSPTKPTVITPHAQQPKLYSLFSRSEDDLANSTNSKSSDDNNTNSSDTMPIDHPGTIIHNVTPQGPSPVSQSGHYPSSLLHTSSSNEDMGRENDQEVEITNQSSSSNSSTNGNTKERKSCKRTYKNMTTTAKLHALARDASRRYNMNAANFAFRVDPSYAMTSLSAEHVLEMNENPHYIQVTPHSIPTLWQAQVSPNAMQMSSPYQFNPNLVYTTQPTFDPRGLNHHSNGNECGLKEAFMAEYCYPTINNKSMSSEFILDIDHINKR
jgi:hypothetical protein